MLLCHLIKETSTYCLLLKGCNLFITKRHKSYIDHHINVTFLLITFAYHLSFRYISLFLFIDIYHLSIVLSIFVWLWVKGDEEIECREVTGFLCGSRGRELEKKC